jgi:hypothetical protein
MEKEEGQVMVTQLLQQIGRLQMELEWLKKSLSGFYAPAQLPELSPV